MRKVKSHLKKRPAASGQAWRTAQAMVDALEPRRYFATFYVAANDPVASDTNPGTFELPFKTIGKAVSSASNNNATSQADTIYIRAGVYRVRASFGLGVSGASDTNRTVISAYVDPATGAYEDVVVSGADLMNSANWLFDESVSRWYMPGHTIRTWGVWADWSSANDGAPLQQIGGYNETNRRVVGSGIADMTPGSFFHDTANSRLYVRLADDGDPREHEMSFAVRPHALYMPGSPIPGGFDYVKWIDFKGLKLRHVNSYDGDGQDRHLGAYFLQTHRAYDLDVQWNGSTGLSMYGNSKLFNSIVSNNGNTGVSGKGEGFLIEGGEFNYNNRRRFTGGVGAGIKVISNVFNLYGDIRNVRAIGNIESPGIWYDTTYSSGQISNVTGNYIADNDGPGLFFEHARGYLAANNVIVNNRGSGVLLLAAENVKIHHNTIVGNHGNAAIELNGGTRGSGDSFVGLKNNDIRGNIIADNYTVFDIGLPLLSNSVNVTNNTSDYNLIWRRGGPLQFTRGGTYLGTWGTTIDSLAVWRSLSGQDLNSISLNPTFVGGTGPLAYRLGSDSPARDAIPSIAGVTADYEGLPRPAGSNADAGAFEYTSGPAGTPSPTFVNLDPSVWVDEVLPGGALPTPPDATGNTGVERFWFWDEMPSTRSGLTAFSTGNPAVGERRQYFTGTVHSVGVDDTLFLWVYLDPAATPRELMIEWRNVSNSFSQRAYWGQDLINLGTNGTNSRRYMGALPPAGQWSLLTVPSSLVGLSGQTVTGVSIRIVDGSARVDQLGSMSALPPAVTGAEYDYIFRDSVTLSVRGHLAPTLSTDDLTLMNRLTSEVIDPASLELEWVLASNELIIRSKDGPLPDGPYSLTLHSAGITDATNRALDGDNNGSPGGDYTFDFDVIAGDLDGDKTVGFDDLGILLGTYGSINSVGDLNDNGSVDFDDLGILLGNYGVSYPAAPLESAVVASLDVTAAETSAEAEVVGPVQAQRQEMQPQPRRQSLQPVNTYRAAPVSPLFSTSRIRVTSQEETSEYASDDDVFSVGPMA